MAARVGALLASRVQMTAMPQLVAILHSFVGLAAVLVGLVGHAQSAVITSTGVEARIHDVEIFIGVFIGAVTFTGSVVAFGKLQGSIGSKPLLLPGRHVHESRGAHRLRRARRRSLSARATARRCGRCSR